MTWTLTRCMIWLMASAALQGAQLPRRPDFGPTEKRQLKVEHIYNLEIRSYTPPVVVPVIKQSAQATRDTPENLAASHFSAMRAGDYTWFMENWDSFSRSRLEQQDHADKRGAEFWTQRWSEMLRNRRVLLQRLITSGTYVLVHYQILPQSENAIVFEEVLPMKQGKDGSWFLTQELASDPIKVYWNYKEETVRQIVR